MPGGCAYFDEYDPSVRRVVRRRRAFPFAPWALFGLSIDGAVATISPGAARIGSATIESAETDVDFTGLDADDYYIAWRIEYDPDTLTVDATPTTDMPEDSDGDSVGPLYLLTWSGTALTLTRVYHGGQVVAPFAHGSAD